MLDEPPGRQQCLTADGLTKALLAAEKKFRENEGRDILIVANRKA